MSEFGFSSRGHSHDVFGNQKERFLIVIKCPRGIFKEKKYSNNKKELEDYFYDEKKFIKNSKAYIYDKDNSTSSFLYELKKDSVQVPIE